MSLMPRKYFLEDFFDDFVNSKDNSLMKCDIYEEDGRYKIELDVPGFDKNDIKIECKKGYLSIIAKRNISEDKIEKNYIRKERSFGEYTRSFYLGDVDTNEIEAKFNNGTLLITIPTLEKQDDKTIIEISE